MPPELADEWARTGLQRVPLEIVDCPDRRLIRAAVECVVRELADGETEVSVLLPDRKYRGIWHRVLHDKTADAILEQVSRLPHANVTTVPFHLDCASRRSGSRCRPSSRAAPGPPARAVAWSSRHRRPDDAGADGFVAVPGCIPIADARWRSAREGRRAGPVGPRRRRSTTRPPWSWSSWTARASISVLFLGRRSIAGVGVGTKMAVEGTVGIHKTRLAILNPSYQLLG